MQVCAEPGCPEPVAYRGRCGAHARQRNQQIDRAGYRIYRTKRWRLTRNRVLAQHPICERCDQRLAEHVHHIVDLAAGGDAWAPSNLQALCARCHNRETRHRQHTGR
jgi:5-methylcytosine-specific restriction endonuclease McrA